MTEPRVATSGESAISFGPFRLLAAQRLLLEGDKPVRLGGRAFDILTALVERAGEVVGKEELIARAWPATYVEEANLKIQVSALRRALGDGQGDNRYVLNVVGRGYNFVAPIRKEEPSRAAPSPTIAPAAPHNLPFATTRMIGREETVTALVRRLSRQRLVTVVGPGGIGKTTVALAVAERMIGAYEHGVWLVDLAPLSDPHLVPSAVATVLGLEIRAEDPLPGLVAALGDRRVLLLLDNCEHVVDAAAGLTAAVLSGAPGVTILATSREPLGVQGERMHRLGPLNTPEPSPGLTAAEAVAFPAVQLFVERVSAIVEDFVLTDADVPLVVAICRRLDGLPLAIEFAAPRVQVLGVEGLAARLDDNLRRLLGAQRRAAMPRHRTMQAVIDWSHGLLGEDEQRFFRALGIFAGGSTAEAAAAVAMDAATTGVNAIDRLADLVTKSLVVADVSGTRPRFRLLDTTRAYAIEKLDENGERERIARRHAEYYRILFERAAGEATLRPAGEWPADYAREIDNLRAALDWAFSPAGDVAIGISLTVSAVPLWINLSMVEECRVRVERALALDGRLGTLETPDQMRLLSALGTALVFTSGRDPKLAATWRRALQIAEALDETDFQLRALWGLWIVHFHNGEHRLALDIAERFRSLALRSNNARDVPVGDRMIGFLHHLLGDLGKARHRSEVALRSFETFSDEVRVAHIGRFQLDQCVQTRITLAHVLWLQGFPDRAIQVAETNVAEATAGEHALSIANALAQVPCPIALLRGDLGAAEEVVVALLECARQSNLPHYAHWARCFDAVLMIRRGDSGRGSRVLRVALNDLRGPYAIPRDMILVAELACALGRGDEIAQAHAVVAEALERCARTGEQWCVAELQRVKGEIVLQEGGVDSEAIASRWFGRALDCARGQGALALELRAATSLARLLRDQGRQADATACLQPVYDRFTEGFGTTDLIAAKQLLDDLGAAGHR
jgi:predicted ATPase/DNA-binding winged helix-turn-helix (wHTH) protein